MTKTHRNSTERAKMLADRAAEQRGRTAGATIMHLGKPIKHERPTEMIGPPAWINRHTRGMHEHRREKARRAA